MAYEKERQKPADFTREQTMIYELRAYTIQPGRAPEFAKLSGDVARPIRGNDYGTLEGYWLSEFGPLNQVVHLWSHADLNARQDARARLGQNKAWTSDFIPQALPLIQKQEIKLMTAVKPLNAPTSQGNVYEYRYYRAKTGKVREFADILHGAFPVREKYSPNVGLWISEAGQPNGVSHMWVYESLNQRFEARAAAMQDKEWQAALGQAGPLLEEMHSMILLPVGFSPMQ